MKRMKQRGHAILELALSAGVMVACLGGTFQFGYTFYVYNELVSAVGNGGRYAAVRTFRGATPRDVEAGKQAIRNMVVYGDSRPEPGAVPVVPGLTADQVDVQWINGPGGEPSAVRVALKHYTVDALFSEFNFDGRPGVEFPFVGPYAPTESEP